MRRTPGFWLLVGACVVVVAAIVAGLLTVGGVRTARGERLDRERLADLDRIHRALAETRLPLSLDSLETRLSDADLTDPATGEPYAYRPLSDSTYELCASFALSSDELGPRFPESPFGAHEAGRHCFVVAHRQR